MSGSGRKPTLTRTYAISVPLWSTSFYPYSEVLHHAEIQKFCHYKVAKNEQFVSYRNEDNHSNQLVGWKLHILIPPECMKRAWERLFPLLQSERIGSFKIRRPDVTISSHKEVTIYQFANPEKTEDDWDEVIRKIENMLIAEECEPGILPPANKMIAGSKFISYRNDSHVDGNYIEDFKAAEYAGRYGLDPSNLSGALDIFAGIDISRPRRTFGKL